MTLLVVAAIAAGVAVFVSRSHAKGSAPSGPPATALVASPASGSPAAASSASPGATSPSPGASAAAVAGSSPSVSPVKPPLTKPTKKDKLRVYFGGDSLSGLPGILFAQLGQSKGVLKVHTDYVVSSRLTNSTPVDWPSHLKSQMASDHPDIGVFLIGINDPGMPMIAKGSYTSYPKKAWLAEYGRRAGKLMDIMLHAGVKRVYWLGLPVMPTGGATNQVKRLNEVFRAEAARHKDVVYVDTFGLLSTSKGKFIAALRSGDGIHFTNEGAGRIAKAVWKAMKADWTPAK
ncbi:MAG: GDSL-type esterase/lipase family protein [Actinomycetes bacterium]